MKSINLEIFKGCTKKVFIKDNFVHYGNGHKNFVQMNPIHIKKSNFDTLKENILHTDLINFIKFINADMEEIPEGKKEKDDDEEKRRRKEEEKKFLEKLEESEGKQILKRKKAEKESERRIIYKGKVKTKTDIDYFHFFLDMPRDIFNVILQLIRKTEEELEMERLNRSDFRKYHKVPYSSIKALFFTSERLREEYLQLFLIYLSLDMTFYTNVLSLEGASFVQNTHFLYNQEILNKIPSNVKILDLTSDIKFNGDLQGILPDSLRVLKLGYKYNRPIGGLPLGLETLEFTGSFNQFLDSTTLPPYLKHLKVGYAFNLPVDDLPQFLLTLQLGSRFNQSIDDLPKTLEKLILGWRFDRPIESLPPYLEYLEFGNSFNQTVDNFPKKLKIMIFGAYFNQSIDSLPDSIKVLELGLWFNTPIQKYPKSLKSLTIQSLDFDSPLNNLPKSLSKLILSDRQVYGAFNQNIDNIPDNITTLILSQQFDTPIKVFPQSLNYLEF